MPKTIMRALKINEISAVDVPAQEGAKAVLMKRADKADTLAKQAAITSSVDGHTHLVVLTGHAGSVLTSGHTEYDETDHTHPWVLDELTGNVVIGQAVDPSGLAHVHNLEFASKVSDGKEEYKAEDEDEDEEDKKPADLQEKTAGDNPEAGGDDAGSISVGNDEGDLSMPDTNKAADTAVAELEKKLVRAEAIAELNDTEKAHFTGLDEMGKDDFLAKSSADRMTEIETINKAALDNDPVMYTTNDGLELRKSAGDAMISIAKSNDELREQNKALAKANADATYAKRAETELGNMPGSVDVRVALLKSIDAIKDEGQRGDVLTAIKAQNETFADTLKMEGHNDGEGDNGGLTADQELDQMAATMATEKGISKAAAFASVLETEKGAALYAKSVG